MCRSKLPALLTASLCSLAAVAQATGEPIHRSPDEIGAAADAGWPAATGSPDETGEPVAARPSDEHRDGRIAQSDADLRPAPKSLRNAGVAHLEFSTEDGNLRARVQGGEAGFLGAVLLALSPRQTHYLIGLPPLLADFAVLGWGFASDQVLEFDAPIGLPDSDFPVFGQALILDSAGLSVSGVVEVG